ncbi:MAG: aminopeptidase [Deinococcus sp.]|nr:aminopeptidase [Deinococcus sp.]MCL5964612.1 aminopeptidase [Deinococcus sp.]
MDDSFDAMLSRFAEVAVKVGVGLLPGQKLMIRSPLEAAPLARKLAEEAYKAGSRFVTVNWLDEQVALARYKYAPRDSFEEFDAWRVDGLVRAIDEGTGVLNISADNPTLLKDQDPELIRKTSQTASRYTKPYIERITSFAVNWCIVPAATPAWASQIFPALTQEEQMKKLWDAIFEVTRMNEKDPVAAWKAHTASLQERVNFLNARRYKALHFKGPGTDLIVGLADGHLWAGGAGKAKNGSTCIPNMPTEEVFTTPHRSYVEGYVTSTKPLSLHGNLIEGIRVRFEQGKAVEIGADKGETVLKNLLDTDEGAKRLGEVALVPHSSPVSKSGILFYDTLFDENAASHIAFGRAYDECLEGSTELSAGQKATKGFNDSLIHTDWMIGSGQVDVDGISQNGQVEPLMRAGEWVS